MNAQKPYNAYRETGLPWLGKIPIHWKLKQVKRIFKVTNGSTPSSGTSDYWDGDIVWITPEDLGKLKSKIIIESMRRISKEGYQSCGTTLVPSGSLILSTRAPIGHLGIAGVELCTNQGCRCLVFKKNDEKTFFFYHLIAVHPELESRGRGSTFQELGKNELETISLAYPPPPEQRAIADFLDRATARIDALIAKYQRFIQLLEEKRANFIALIVTRGVNPSMPSKESNLPWLGNIPTHWNIVRNVNLFKEHDERNYPNLPLLNVSIHTGVTLREFSTEHVEQVASDWSTYKVARRGDIAFNKMRMWQGAVGVAPMDGLVSPDYTVAHPRNNVNPQYYEYLFRTNAYKNEINRFSHGIVPDRNRLYWEQFKQMPSLCPPFEEQNEIVEYLGRETKEVWQLMQKIKKMIELLQEYRSSIISSIVSGKIDLSGWSK